MPKKSLKLTRNVQVGACANPWPILDTVVSGARVSQHYIEGIKEGRIAFEREGMSIAEDELRNLDSTIKGFSAESPVGQMLRGERDFWKHQLKIQKC